MWVDMYHFCLRRVEGALPPNEYYNNSGEQVLPQSCVVHIVRIHSYQGNGYHICPVMWIQGHDRVSKYTNIYIYIYTYIYICIYIYMYIDLVPSHGYRIEGHHEQATFYCLSGTLEDLVTSF